MAHAGGGLDTRRMDGNGQQQEPPSLDFFASFFYQEKNEGLPGEGKKKPARLKRKKQVALSDKRPAWLNMHNLILPLFQYNNIR